MLPFVAVPSSHTRNSRDVKSRKNHSNRRIDSSTKDNWNIKERHTGMPTTAGITTTRETPETSETSVV
jgi:hypothetical protein